jgi:nitroreductase
MDLDAAIAGRRSTRDFTGEEVDEPTIRRLIDAAVSAPNASNAQPWTFTVVRDQAVLDQISRSAKSWLLSNLPEAFQSDRYRTRLADPTFHVFYHAPVMILISGIAPGSWVVEDCALAAENMMLTAHAAGLGTCWIGFAQGYLNTAEGRGTLGLPEASVPVAPIVVGHPVAAPAPVARQQPQIRWVG